VEGAQEGRYEEFRGILGDAVDEDWQGLWEPLFWPERMSPSRAMQVRRGESAHPQPV